jgi:putative tricarboxylic transport membrane protein
MIETQFRRSLILSNGSYEIFFTRPITVFLLAMAVASIIYTVYRGSEKLKEEEKSET